MKKQLSVLTLCVLSAMPLLASAANASVVRRIACYARNSRGVTFEAVGTYAPRVESTALSKCLSFGATGCYSTGCRVVYLRQGD